MSSQTWQLLIVVACVAWALWIVVLRIARILRPSIGKGACGSCGSCGPMVAAREQSLVSLNLPVDPRQVTPTSESGRGTAPGEAGLPRP